MSYHEMPCTGCGVRMVGQKHVGKVPEGFKRHMSKGRCTKCYERERRASQVSGVEDHVEVEASTTTRRTEEENRAALESWQASRRRLRDIERAKQLRIQQERVRAQFLARRAA